jgi:hypothetical protein
VQIYEKLPINIFNLGQIEVLKTRKTPHFLVDKFIIQKKTIFASN